ncbi:hypothetical protein HW452_03185 [Halomonas aquamarina]|uniref:Uncharacterized protein n=1 Tax=Vreelandella aquamarina TaxID=77097 RepID=A0ACC5VQH0_9GAMM|nr:STN domain-containing protein [Halomonas aquamarina]MBZ5486521.1 hypothetical protein [Halomonas aquamarina]
MKHRYTAAFLLSTMFTLPVYADCQREAIDHDISPQRLDEALHQLAQRSGCFIAIDPTLLADEQAPALNGTYRPEEALWELLKGSGWEGYPTDEGLEVSKREQAWVEARTQALRETVQARDSLSEDDRMAYFQELAALEQSVSELAREQGFISAGEHASFERRLNELAESLETDDQA